MNGHISLMILSAVFQLALVEGSQTVFAVSIVAAILTNKRQAE
jgi:hypothetical protein